MSRIRRLLEWEVVSPQNHKYVYMWAGAIVGGIVFALIQSWFWAIAYDMLTALSCWTVFKFTEPLLNGFFRFFRD